MIEAGPSKGIFKRILAEIRGNAFWDVIKNAGWYLCVALMAMIRWLQSASRWTVISVLLVFWAASLLMFFLVEFRRRKREGSALILPAGFPPPLRSLTSKMLMAGIVLAVLFAAAGIAFSLWFKQSTVLPLVSIEPIYGLPVGFPQDPHLRLHRLVVRNEQGVELQHFVGRVQFPEAIFATAGTNHPMGTLVGWRPLLEPIAVSGTSGKSFIGPSSSTFYLPHESFFPDGAEGELFKLSRDGDLTGVWELTIDRLPRHAAVTLLFLSSDGPTATNYLELVNTEFVTNGAQVKAVVEGTSNGATIIHDLSFTATLNHNTNYHFGTNALKFSIEGRFQYQEADKAIDQRFLVPLRYDGKTRNVTAAPVRASDGHWRRIIVEFQ